MKPHVFKINNGEITISMAGVTSTGLKEPCPYCSSTECRRTCDQGQSDPSLSQDEEQRLISNAMIDGMEWTLLALTQAGFIPDVLGNDEGALKNAIQTVVDRIGNDA